MLVVVLDDMQEQHDQLQRQQQQAVAREGELRASLDTYKTEHMQLLNANAQLVEKCQTLNKRVQVRHCQTYGAPAYRRAPCTLPIVRGMQGTSMLI